MSSVKIEFTADDHDLLASYQRQQSEILKNQRALMRMGESGKKTTDDTSAGFGRMTAQLSTMFVSYGAVTRAASEWLEANRELRREAEEAGKSFDEMFRKFRVQSGLRGLEATAAENRIISSAVRFAVPNEQAEAAARQLVSSGFAPDQASGQALDEVLSVLSASNIRGEETDPTELVLSISKFLTAQGLDLTAGNIRRVGRPVQGLFRSTNIQLPQLGELSKEAPNFSRQMTVEEQLATFSQMVDVFEPSVAATGMRNVVSRLATSRETPGRVDALARMGITPDQVDFVGEGAFDVFERLQTGIQAAPEEERAGLLKLLFEERGVAPALTILDNLDEIRRRHAGIGDVGQFEADLEEATSGRNAAAIRQENLKDQRRSARDEFDDLVASEIVASAEERGLPPAISDRARRGFETARDFGVPQDIAVGLSTPGIHFMGDAPRQVMEGVNRNMQSSLEQIERNTRQSGGGPPSAGLSRTN